MTVLRSRGITPSPKTTPKSRKATQNDTMADHIEPCTPNRSKEPDPAPAPPRRSPRLSHRPAADEPLSPTDDGTEALVKDGSGSVGARVWSESGGFVEGSEEEEEDSGDVGVLSLRSGRRVAKRGGDGEAGEGERERERAGGDVSAVESGKGKRKMASGSGDESGVGGGGRRRFSREEMGKGKLGEEGSGSNGNGGGGSGGGDGGSGSGLGLGLGLGREVRDGDLPHNAVPVEGRVEQHGADGEHWRQRMEGFREAARRSAAHFAHFNGEEAGAGGEELPAAEVDEGPDVEDWPGPFSTAWKIIRDREKRSSRAGLTFSVEGKPADVEWVPRNCRDRKRSNVLVPSLVELSLKSLLNVVDNLPSLDMVPDSLRNWMCKLLSDSRRLNGHFLRLLLQGSPMEVCVRDCSWLTEEELMESVEQFDARSLTVLQLDLCGRCLPDYVLLATFAQSSNSLPALNTISLRGACRLSDDGVNSLVSSAPALTSINLSQCSLLTYSSIDTIADSLGSILRKLYLDDCQGIDVMLMVPALKKFEQLEVLSVSGIESVCDEFILEFVSICGHNMKELILTDCIKLTDSSVKVIAEKCPGLRTIDLSKCKLTDSALGYLANGCRSIQRLRLCRSPFSDKSIAAFLETSGECLEELSLNNVKKVGCQTALSIARRAGKLHSLDLSWCRDLTDNALGLIVDNCLSLRVLKLFGCTQITEVFLNGHSNPEVKIIGFKMSPVLEDFWKPNP